MFELNYTMTSMLGWGINGQQIDLIEFRWVTERTTPFSYSGNVDCAAFRKTILRMRLLDK
jgi:hypothetical protein